MQFRHDIQILRGIAVSLVVLFHLEFSQLASGFLGVDIFFVISGFLMAVLYKTGNVHDFFERRAKRLLPSYFAVVIGTLLASMLLLLPSEMIQVEKQAFFSLFFANNLSFWTLNTYFDKSNFKPLLHLWSLGVEIQFYLFVPLLVWFFNKNRALLLLTTLISLGLCIYEVGISPKTSFFMMPLRLWEFLIGFMVAKYFTEQGNLKFNQSWIGLIGLCLLVAIPFMHVNGNSFNRIEAHPSLFALLVCLATAVILVFGLPKFLINSPIAKLFVYLGKYSYSIYLVHFPVIVLYLYKPFSGTIMHPANIQEQVTLLILIMLLSVLLYKLIETRKYHHIFKVYIIGCITVLGLIGCSKVIYQTQYTQVEKNIFSGLTDRSVYRCGLFFPIIHPNTLTCRINTDEQKQSVVLLGNSHSDSIKNVFADIAVQHGFNTYLFAVNDPMTREILPPEAIIQETLRRHAKWIFIHYKVDTLNPNKLDRLAELAAKHQIRLSLIMPVPVYEHGNYYYKSIPATLYYGRSSHITEQDYLKRNQALIQQAKQLEARYPNFQTLPVVQTFCTPVCQISTADKRPYYFDDDHLTLTGSQLMVPVIRQAFEFSR